MEKLFISYPCLWRIRLQFWRMNLKYGLHLFSLKTPRENPSRKFSVMNMEKICIVSLKLKPPAQYSHANEQLFTCCKVTRIKTNKIKILMSEHSNTYGKHSFINNYVLVLINYFSSELSDHNQSVSQLIENCHLPSIVPSL